MCSNNFQNQSVHCITGVDFSCHQLFSYRCDTMAVHNSEISELRIFALYLTLHYICIVIDGERYILRAIWRNYIEFC